MKLDATISWGKTFGVHRTHERVENAYMLTNSLIFLPDVQGWKFFYDCKAYHTCRMFNTYSSERGENMQTIYQALYQA